jgi:hypothetical protein
MISESEYCLFLVGTAAGVDMLTKYSLHISLGPLPSIFGLHIATYVLCELAEKPISNPLPIKNRRNLYERMLRDLLNREQKFAGKIIKCVV